MPKWITNNKKHKIIFKEETISRVNKLRFGYQIQFVSSGDGVSRGYKMPYFNS